MFKIFKSKLFLYIITMSVFCFLQIMESYANFGQSQLQGGGAVTLIKEDTKMGIVDMSVLRNIGEQDELAFGKTEAVSLYDVFWGSIGVVGLLASLITVDIPGIVVSLIGLLI
ncbi:hypothetical protein ABID23_001250 [Bartonella silvatica]|uniref:Uncharacterized protein n=1 Tax=Bartonella silvatica TaxID=357760 RepID=A0ABV2HHZ9_9HYPH